MEGFFIVGVIFLIAYLLWRASKRAKAKLAALEEEEKAKIEAYNLRVEERKQEFFEDIPEANDDKRPFYFIFDLETNGLPVYYDAEPDDLNNWPHPLSVAYVILNEELELVREGYFLLKQNCELDHEALRINGLTEEQLTREGKDPKEVYEFLLKEIKESKRLVAHNIEFDLPILQADFIRNGFETKVFRKRKICTMKKSTSILMIPRLYGSGYKWPKLSELIAYCFFIDENYEDFEFEEAHNAQWDSMATAKCFIHLLKSQEIKA